MPLPGPLKNLFRGIRGPAGPNGPGSTPPAGARSSGRSADDIMTTRPSRGLEEFFSYIRDQSGLTILDLGGATQQNVSFITNLGHRLYSEDFLQILQETFDQGAADQSNTGRIDYFLRQALEYPEAHFDGVLVGDFRDPPAPALLTAVIGRLHTMGRRKSYMRAFSHPDKKRAGAPYYPSRFKDVNMLRVSQ